MPYYESWKKQINSLQVENNTVSEDLKIGWSKVNITPKQPRSMAGYGKRSFKPYESVNDSVFVRALYLQQNNREAVMIASDLLITPPAVLEVLEQKLKAINLSMDQIYFGATHTHSSVGGWGGKIAGLLFAGSYDEQVVVDLADAMFNSILKSRSQTYSAKINYREAVDSLHVRNRLVGEEGTIDPEVRSVEFITEQGQKIMLATYAAHSTILGAGNMILSRDYPGVLVDHLENKGYAFALYMAGAVGSMAPNVQGDNDLEKMQKQVTGIDSMMFQKDVTVRPQAKNWLDVRTLEWPLREPTPRVTLDLGLRTWVFKQVFGDYTPQIKVLKLGNILLVGMPADFSGELISEVDAYAKTKGLDLIVTSFNGGYIGYVTDDKHYERDLYETVIMSWYGPYNGAYSQEIIKDIIDKFAE